MNTPTVGELLQDCAREVRSILWDITALDGPALAAAWPGFATHAGDALTAVPRPDPATRLLAGRMAGPRSRPNRWGPPIGAEPDSHLVAAGRALASVAALLHRHASTPRSPQAAREANLARRRIAECLLIGAHATALGLQEHATRLQPARPGVAFDRPDVRVAVSGATLAQSRRLTSDLDTLQAHAVHYLAGTPGRASQAGGELFVDPDRLPHVLAMWEVAALRILHAALPSVRDLAGVAHAEQALLLHTMVILNAAAQTGVIDPDAFTAQIHPRLANAHLGWGDVAASWPAQMTTAASAALLGVEASAQLHQALGEIARDGNGWAAPDLIARRVDLGEVTGLLRDALGAGGARAQRFAELPGELARAGQLQAPARLLAAMDPSPNGSGPGLAGAVRTSDVANRRIVAVRPGQTRAATATARDLGRHVTSLNQALETLNLGRGRLNVAEPALIAGEAAGVARPAGALHAGNQPGRHVRAAR